jgi:hypothetical protein
MDNNIYDDIRIPDPVKKEKLIDSNIDYNSNLLGEKAEQDLNIILEMSKKEFLEQEEEKTIDLICNQIKEEQFIERQNKFNTIKTQLNKIILFDKPNLKYYELILSVIEMYELGIIHIYYCMNQNEYTNIFKILKSIRLPNTEIDNIKKLIICE